MELHRLATQISQTVRVMDGRIRQRFEDNPQALGAWLSARQVLGTPKLGGSAPAEPGSPETPAGGEVRPPA